MLSLHNTTALTKNIAKWVGISLTAVILFFLIIRIGVGIKNLLFPRPQPPPTVRFGKLPKIPFKESLTQKPLTYNINTVSGDLPSFPDRANVYILNHPRPGLLDLNDAKGKASIIGFKGQEKKIFENIYEWKNSGSLPTTLTYNIVTHDFKFTSPFLTNTNALSGLNLQNENDAIGISFDFLKQIGAQTDDFDMNKITTYLLAIKNTTLVSASSLSNAQVIHVDFHQKDVDRLPIFYPYPPHSLINFLVTSGVNTPVIAEGNYFHQAVSDISSTYPIKTTRLAFDELKSGKAYIGSFEGSGNSIAITDVLLGYYLTDEIQSFLMPVIVFKGENGFYAFVSAISDSFIIQ